MENERDEGEGRGVMGKVAKELLWFCIYYMAYLPVLNAGFFFSFFLFLLFPSGEWRLTALDLPNLVLVSSKNGSAIIGKDSSTTSATPISEIDQGADGQQGACRIDCSVPTNTPPIAQPESRGSHSFLNPDLNLVNPFALLGSDIGPVAKTGMGPKLTHSRGVIPSWDGSGSTQLPQVEGQRYDSVVSHLKEAIQGQGLDPSTAGSSPQVKVTEVYMVANQLMDSFGLDSAIGTSPNSCLSNDDMLGEQDRARPP